MMSTHTDNVRGTEFGPSEEYKSLREEMLQAKKYVFERPLFIAAIATAGWRAIDKEFIFLLLVLVSSLLLFNFWFTVNRLLSAARIAAYIQLEIEERSHGHWIGWETCLREYRLWLNDERSKKREEIDNILRTKVVPDALMFYDAIYRLHIGLMALTVGLALALVTRSHTWGSIFSVCKSRSNNPSLQRPIGSAAPESNCGS